MLTENQRYLIVSLGAEFMAYPDSEVDYDKLEKKTIEHFQPQYDYVLGVITDFEKTGESMTDDMFEFMGKFMKLEWPVISKHEIGGHSHLRDLPEFEPIEELFLKLIK